MFHIISRNYTDQNQNFANYVTARHLINYTTITYNARIVYYIN